MFYTLYTVFVRGIIGTVEEFNLDLKKKKTFFKYAVIKTI